MRKTKRLFAVLLTLAMVLGISGVTFGAVDTVYITITAVDKDSVITYDQIIEPVADDPEMITGWKFSGNEAAERFKAAITADEKNTDKSDQEIIAGLMMHADSTIESKLPESLKGDKKAVIDATLFEKALKAAAVTKTEDLTKDGDNYKIAAKNAGVYVIHATDVKKTDANGKVTGWIKYNPMASYVSFDYTGGSMPALKTPDTITAKSEPYDASLEKTDNESDGVTAVGDVVTYTISTVVPYISDDIADENVYFNIVDMIKGAQYVSVRTVTDGPTAEDMSNKVATTADQKAAVTVKLEDQENDMEMLADIIEAADPNYTYSFSLDLKDIAKDRTNAGKTLEITYKAYVTATVIENYAQTKVKTANDQSTPEDGPGDDDMIYTGTLKMTKYNGDAEGENSEKLANAKFVLYYQKYRTENDEKILDDTKYYAVTEPVAGGAGIDYQVTGWSTENPVDKNDDTCLLITKKSTNEEIHGTFTIKGLEDDEDREYFFEEVAAPEGYSLNSTPEGITWDAGRGNVASAASRLGEAAMSDTKLSALPSTGGIGTTIFTIAGCLIMIAAAGLFFVSRRKSEK